MADRSHQQLERVTVADGAQVESGRVGGDGVPGGEVGESDGGGEGGDDGVDQLIGSRDVGCFWQRSRRPGWGRGQRSCCHRYDFLVCLWNGLNFFKLFKLLFSFGIDHDPPCSLYSHDLCLFLFLCFILHTITWPREVIIVL